MKHVILIFSFLLFVGCSSKYDQAINFIDKHYDSCSVEMSIDKSVLKECIQTVQFHDNDSLMAKAYYLLAEIFIAEDSIVQALDQNSMARMMLSGIERPDTLLVARVQNQRNRLYSEFGIHPSHDGSKLPENANDSVYARHKELLLFVESDARRCSPHAVIIDITVFMLGVLSCSLIFLIAHLIIRRRKSISEMRALYVGKLHELEKVQFELNALLENKDSAFENLLQEKQELADSLRAAIEEIDKSKKIESYVQKENFLLNAPIVEHFKVYATAPQPGMKLTSADWAELRNHISTIMPSFFTQINKRTVLRDDEERLCMLVRIHMKPSAISNIMQISRQSVSVNRTRLCAKVFGIDKGSAALFDRKMIEMS